MIWRKVVAIEGRYQRLACGHRREPDLLEMHKARPEVTVDRTVPCAACTMTREGMSRSSQATPHSTTRPAPSVALHGGTSPADANVRDAELDLRFQESRRARVMAREDVIRSPRLT